MTTRKPVSPRRVGPIALGLFEDDSQIVLLPASNLRANVRFAYATKFARTWGEFFRMNARDIAPKLRRDVKEHFEDGLGQPIPNATATFRYEDLGYSDDEPFLPGQFPQKWAYDFFGDNLPPEFVVEYNPRDLMVGIRSTALPWVLGYLIEHGYEMVRCDELFNCLFVLIGQSSRDEGEYSKREVDTLLRRIARTPRAIPVRGRRRA